MCREGSRYRIGQRIKSLRRASKLTQAQMGAVIGVSASAWQKLESGERGLSSENCIQLAELFGVSCDYILTGEHPAQRIHKRSEECRMIAGQLFEAADALERIWYQLIRGEQDDGAETDSDGGYI